MKKPTKEHFFAKWLIRHTKMLNHKIKWLDGNVVYPMTATIPLCGQCNSEFGRNLEAPMMKILQNIESGLGVSDNEAEIFVRWAWKMEGLSWRLAQPDDNYSKVYTVRDRVLKKIDNIRSRLVLAIALVEDPYEGKEYLPLGFCNMNENNAIVMSGVISSVAFIVLTDDQIGNLPIQFSYWRLKALRDKLGDARLFYPKTGFKNFTEARDLTRLAANTISKQFDIDHAEDIAAEIKSSKDNLIIL
ncbi:Uncharacterised protein [Aeromonas hydrophila]|nr:Uncharacterised protein [Aeromonas hydrophila]